MENASIQARIYKTIHFDTIYLTNILTHTHTRYEVVFYITRTFVTTLFL